MEPADIGVGHVREWVGALAGAGRKAATISAYRSVLRQVLDFAELDRPNPARDPRVRLPTTVRTSRTRRVTRTTCCSASTFRPVTWRPWCSPSEPAGA